MVAEIIDLLDEGVSARERETDLPILKLWLGIAQLF